MLASLSVCQISKPFG
ncbi:microbial collagenase domain protein, partial [Vibrio parahaemolyticus V-223/04]